MEIFKELIVVELASVLAGPAVGLFFAELGAKVIKVENKTTNGDVTRNWKLPNEPTNSSISSYYCSVNWNKETLLLDLSQDTDKQQVINIIKDADIVVSNFKKESATQLGMDYEQLSALNEKLIYAQLNSYHEQDNTPAFDVVLQAETGFLYMNGEPERPPVKMPVALIDILAAHQLKEGILCALWQRERTQKGAYIHVSLFDSAVASLANQATNWLMCNHIPQRMGALHPNIAPYGDTFYTADNQAIVLAVGTEKQFVILCKCLDIDDISNNTLYNTNAQRVKNRTALNEILTDAFLKLKKSDILPLLKAKGVPCGSINNLKDVFEIPQAQSLILEDTLPDGRIGKRVKTVVFSIENTRKTGIVPPQP